MTKLQKHYMFAYEYLIMGNSLCPSPNVYVWTMAWLLYTPLERLGFYEKIL
ncbi:hypothetical protein acsn021_44690 [Anaerocolumna cellulosilytica]|uniref:Uncharacterized protein n=1 Tax=Anaerocolumna cellulosilytica TaxID=433286 RepID=A0A6S6RBK7_9FIRM|nr:hypothetical protein acsn021_44690 [Anaerocolumna cellulosilytica]